MDWLRRMLGQAEAPRMLETTLHRAEGPIGALLEGLRRTGDFALASLEEETAAWWLPNGAPVPSDEELRFAPRRIGLARALLRALAERLGPEQPLQMVLDLSSPGDAIGAEPCSEEEGGVALPPASDEEIQDYLMHWWLRLRCEHPVRFELRLGDVVLRRRIHPDPDEATGTMELMGPAEEVLVHAPFRTRVQLAAGLAEEEGARWIEALRQAPPPEGLGPARLRAEQEGETTRLHVDLAPGDPLDVAHAPALLAWMWPSRWAGRVERPPGDASPGERAAAIGSTRSEGTRASGPRPEETAGPEWHVPDAEEMRRIELWAQREWRKMKRRRMLEVALGIATVLLSILYVYWMESC